MLKKYYKTFKKEAFPEVCVLKAESEDKFCDTIISIDWYKILFNRISFISLATQKFNDCKYLEIGTDLNLCFNCIPVIDKTGVDPKRGGTVRKKSDDFFKNNQKMILY